MMTQDEVLYPSTEVLGVLACISDAVIIHANQTILFCNAAGHALTQNSEMQLLEKLQFNEAQHNLHQLQLKTAEQRLLVNCLPIEWEGQHAQAAIIRVIDDDLSKISPAEENKLIRGRFDSLFKTAGDGYWDWYIPDASVFFSIGWLQMLGYNAADIEPSFNAWINLIHPDDLGNFLLTWTEYMDKPANNFSIEYRIRCNDNTYLWVEAHAIKELNDAGEVIHLVGFHRDINERKLNETKLREYQEDLEKLVALRTHELEKANSKLTELANQDPLTRLHNRRSFNDYLQQQFLVARRNNQTIAVVMMDIDHFKSFNDSYGHQQGDECLVSVASAIKAALLRPSDFAARIGGEEFVTILQDTNIHGAIQVAQRIQSRIANLSKLPLNPTTKQHITLSIGIATSLQASQEEIIELADKALYAAKNNGRNQLCYFSDNLESVSYIMNNSIL